MTGFVSIVGAGPGAPDLLTVRAARRLEEADLVLHDGLVPLALVEIARHARRLPVSRRPGSTRVQPAAAAGLMIDAARANQRVVRLRAGDPFILARGAEEALELVRAGVPFEIVPGLTTASVAPTLAGIPLTHRGVASGFLVVSGHAPEAYAPVLTTLPPHAVTLVVLMGLAERGRIAQVLMERGWRRDTPSVLLLAASHPDAHVRACRLDRLAEESPQMAPGTPGVLVIGDVVDVGLTIAAAMTPGGRAVEEIEWQP